MLVTFQFTFDKTSIGTGESFGYTVKINLNYYIISPGPGPICINL